MESFIDNNNILNFKKSDKRQAKKPRKLIELVLHLLGSSNIALYIIQEDV